MNDFTGANYELYRPPPIKNEIQNLIGQFPGSSFARPLT